MIKSNSFSCEKDGFAFDITLTERCIVVQHNDNAWTFLYDNPKAIDRVFRRLHILDADCVMDKGDEQLIKGRIFMLLPHYAQGFLFDMIGTV